MAGPENTIDPLLEKGRMAPFGEQTFLGSRRVSTRLRLFVFFVVLAFGGAGGIFYYADKTLNLSDQRNAEASIIAQRAANIEKQMWQLRNTEREFTLSKDPKHIGVYQSIFKSLNERLSLLKSISSTKTIKEHIATVNDGTTQHAKAFEQLNHHNNKKLNAQLKKLAKILDESAKAVEEHLTKVTIASLSDSFAHIRQTESRFKASGATAELKSQAKQIDEFNRLLTTAPISKKDRSTFKRLIKTYQNDMTAFAKIRLSQFDPAVRLNEIFTYLLPSLNGISSFATHHSASVQRTTKKSRQMARIAVAAGIGAILIALTLLTIMLMQSLAAPIRGIAEGAEKLVKGDHNTRLPALGNHDEIGEVARALNILKETLAETTQLQQQLQLTRLTLSQSEKNLLETQTNNKNLEETATSAVSAARHETQSAQQELEQANANTLAAQQALEQEETNALTAQQALEQEIVKTRAAQQALEQEKEKQATQASQKPTEQPAPNKTPIITPVPAAKDAPIESIAALSDRLAQSSQTATGAAFDAERTSTLIRGLNDAETQLDRIEPLIRLIGRETNIPAANQPTGAPNDTHRNLVALSSDQANAASQDDQDLRKRFETVRKAAIQVLQTVRIVNRALAESKGAALEIAAASSASALKITTDLLEQSENLRGMLNNLIGTLHSTTPPEKPLASVKPSIKTPVKILGKAQARKQVPNKAKKVVVQARPQVRPQTQPKARPKARPKPKT
jgi:CHASE3 domain sensor protein/HAMP domain-containing protein